MLHQLVGVDKEKKRLVMQEQADTEKQIYERSRICSADQWGLNNDWSSQTSPTAIKHL